MDENVIKQIQEGGCHIPTGCIRYLRVYHIFIARSFAESKKKLMLSNYLKYFKFRIHF